MRLALIFAITAALTALVVWSVGENPFTVLQVLAHSALGSGEGFSYTLFYATPLLLTGLAVLLPLEAGLFNIGAEGQLYMGSLAAAGWGVYCQRFFTDTSTSHSIFFVSFCWFMGVLLAFSGGALWGGLAGYLRIKYKVHEVIATIMLNFVAMAFSNWVILSVLKNPENQNAESRWIPEALRMPRLWEQTTWSLPLALVLTALVLFALKRTWWGYRVRASGQNPKAAALGGIEVPRTILSSMVVAGGLAGLVGFHEVFGHAYRLIDGFSPGYGFTGLAIALLSRGHPVGFIMTALFFGALHKGALDLDLETEHITRDLAAIIQALILLALAAQTRRRRHD